MTQNIIILGTAVLWNSGRKNTTSIIFTEWYDDDMMIVMIGMKKRKKRVEASLERGAVSLAGHTRGRFGQTAENNGVAERKMKMEAEKRSSWTLNESLVANYYTKDVRDNAVILTRGCLGRSPGNNWEKDLQSKTVCSLLFEVQFDKPVG